MHFWLPLLIVEAVIVWLVYRGNDSSQSADEQIGSAIATLVFAAIFVIADVLIFIVRNW